MSADKRSNERNEKDPSEKKKPRQDVPGKESEAKEAPAGNAIYDPSQQSHRRDMPDQEQIANGEPRRGNLPPGT